MWQKCNKPQVYYQEIQHVCTYNYEFVAFSIDTKLLYNFQ